MDCEQSCLETGAETRGRFRLAAAAGYGNFVGLFFPLGELRDREAPRGLGHTSRRPSDGGLRPSSARPTVSSDQGASGQSLCTCSLDTDETALRCQVFLSPRSAHHRRGTATRYGGSLPLPLKGPRVRDVFRAPGTQACLVSGGVGAAGEACEWRCRPGSCPTPTHMHPRHAHHTDTDGRAARQRGGGADVTGGEGDLDLRDSKHGKGQSEGLLRVSPEHRGLLGGGWG